MMWNRCGFGGMPQSWVWLDSAGRVKPIQERACRLHTGFGCRGKLSPALGVWAVLLEQLGILLFQVSSTGIPSFYGYCTGFHGSSSKTRLLLIEARLNLWIKAGQGAPIMGESSRGGAAIKINLILVDLCAKIEVINNSREWSCCVPNPKGLQDTEWTCWWYVWET